MAKYKIHKTKKGAYYIEEEDKNVWGAEGYFKTKEEAEEEITKKRASQSITKQDILKGVMD